MTRRLLEDWLPIAALGEESVRERRSMTALPPTNYLHVWWARRPLVASRAAILASLLPSSADRDRFTQMVGIHGDPVATRRRIDAARRKGEVFDGDAYGYSRAFTYVPSESDLRWSELERAKIGLGDVLVLDPTAGGGSIPFESVCLGLSTLGNDLNPVASIVQRATIEFPFKVGSAAKAVYRKLADNFVKRRQKRLAALYPKEPDENAIPTNFLWARTIRCPHCEGLIPLSPNWILTIAGLGVRLDPINGAGPGDSSRRVEFTLVDSLKQQSPGTVTGGDATCPFTDCGRLVPGDDVKSQAQAGQMGEQLFAIAFKRREIVGRTKSGKAKEKWVRGYRTPTPTLSPHPTDLN